MEFFDTNHQHSLLHTSSSSVDVTAWCLLCSARLHRHHGSGPRELRSKATGATSKQARIDFDVDNSRPHLDRAWCQIFNLPRARLPWFEELLGGSGGTGGTEVCEACSHIMEEATSCWIQLNELYSRIGRLREQVVGALRTAIQEDGEREDDKDKGLGLTEVEKARRASLLDELHAAEPYQVDQEALNLTSISSSSEVFVSRGLLNSETKIIVGQGQLLNSRSTPTESDTDTQLQNEEQHFNASVDDVEIKVEVVEPVPEQDTDGDPDWVPSPLPSPPLADDADVVAGSDFGSTTVFKDRATNKRRRRSRHRSPSPDTVSHLVNEIHSGQRQLYVPLKHVRWDAEEHRWVIPRFRQQAPAGYNPKWKQIKQIARERKAAKARGEIRVPRRPRPSVDRHRHRLAHGRGYQKCRHKGVHTSKGPKAVAEAQTYRCRLDPDNCTQRFAAEICRDAHELKVHQADDRPFKCKLMSAVSDADGATLTKPCGQTFRKLSNLRGHQKVVHDVYADEKEPPMTTTQNSCAVCGKVFRARGGLKRHMDVHSSNPRFRCEECSTNFPTKDGLRHHVFRLHKKEELQANPEPDQKCRFCPKVSAYKNYIKRHEILLHGATDHPEVEERCPVLSCPWPDCAFRCFGIHRLRIHEASHRNERAFRCEVDGCQAAYNHKRRLVDHMRKHTGERPYQCTHPGCTSAFRVKTQLSNHIKVIHEKDNPPLRCEMCGEGFPIRKYLLRHLERHRTGKIP